MHPAHAKNEVRLKLEDAQSPEEIVTGQTMLALAASPRKAAVDTDDTFAGNLSSCKLAGFGNMTKKIKIEMRL